MYKITDYLWRGPRPTFRELIDGNIRTELDLESGFYQATHADSLEGVDWESYGLNRISYPLSDFFAPSKDQLEACCRLIDKYAVAEHGKMLVHCLTGKDRTGMVIAYYQITRLKMDKEQAIAEWKAYGRHWQYGWWEIYLRRYVA